MQGLNRPRIELIPKEGALRLSLRMDKVNVSAVIDDPNIVTLTWFILSRVTAPYQMQNPGIKEGKQKG